MTKRGFTVSRREALAFGTGAIALSAFSPSLHAQTPADAEVHGLSYFGDLKYPAGFKNFDYVNVNAPKGGGFSYVATQRAFNQSFFTFNTMNSFIFKGDGALGMELTFSTLMVRALDEPDALYGMAARAVKMSADGRVYRFLMRPEARFHDGSKLTAHDAAFSLNVLKEKGHPIIQQLLRDFTGAEAADDQTLVVNFAEKRGREVPLTVAGLPIFSRAYYAKRTFDEATMDIPLGSGPYKVGRFESGRYIEFDRVKDWWAKDLAVSQGTYNFDTVRYEYYRDRDVAFEGFTGKSYLFREEYTSRIWATRYDFPAVKDGRVKLETLPDEAPSGAQGWFINIRREKFKDPRVREALCDAFDFEWTNKNIMYGVYERTKSLFENSDMLVPAGAKPSPEELALLEPFRGKVPDEVFDVPFVPPVSDGSGQDRALLRKASQLLLDAGYAVKNGKRVTPKGDVFKIEFLLEEPSFQPHHMPYIKNLGVLGIEATLRMVDVVQYRARRDDFDFDMTVNRLPALTTPGDSLRSQFSSQAASIKGSENVAGIADPVIDALIEKIIAANTRAEMTVACRAFDRVFRAGRYWVPQWNRAVHPVAYWNVFGHPPKLPRYIGGVGAPDIWWYDSDKAAKLGQR